MKSYKIIVPKPAEDAEGKVNFYEEGTIIAITDDKKDSEAAVMERFLDNGWAIEVKTVEPEVTKPAPKAKAEKETDNLNAKKPSPRKKTAKKTL